MSARQKSPRKRQPAAFNTTTPGTESPVAPPRQGSSPLAGTESAFGECVGAICLVEVTLHSLESQDIASPEQEVLKRALKTMWFMQDWIAELVPDNPEWQDPDEEGVDGEDEL